MKVARSRLWTCLALCVLAGILTEGSAQAGLFGIWGSRKKAVKIERVSLVVFPFDQSSISRAPEGFGEYVASDLRSLLTSSPRYSAYLYKDRLAPIRRASGDGSLKPADSAAPFAEDKAKAFKLAQLLCADYYLVGEIDDLRMETGKRHAEITLRADLLDARTGKLVKTFLVTGQTPAESTTGDEDELRDIAKGAAVTKLMAELNTPPAEETKVAPAVVKMDETPAQEPETKEASPAVETEKPASPPPASAQPKPNNNGKADKTPPPVAPPDKPSK